MQVPTKIKNSLVKRLFFISLPSTLLAGLLYAGAIVYIESLSLKDHQQAQVHAKIKQLAQVIAIPTWNLDHQFIRRYLTEYAVTPHIECIEVVSDGNLEERAPRGCLHTNEGGTLHVEPIILEGQDIGIIITSFTIELDNQQLKFILLSRIPMALVALLSIFFVVFLVFRRWVVMPIRAIIKSIESFQDDAAYHPVNWHSEDEIGTLVEAFNQAQKQQIQHERMLTSERDKAQNTLLELKEAQKQLVESEKMASLGSLVAGISHEINTPLGVARTSSSHVNDALLKLEKLFDAGTLTKGDMEQFIVLSKDGLHLMTANLIRASELMTSFKQVSSDQSHDEIRQFNLLEYLQEIIYTLKPNLKRYQVAILLECDESIILQSFPGAFYQIFTNLIINSLNHAFEPQAPGSIRINVKETGHYVHIVYEDDGAGMTEDVCKKIFDPFFTTKRGNGGTGLGMHILYNLICHKLQGFIGVSSTLGDGCSFNMKLPKVLPTSES